MDEPTIDPTQAVPSTDEEAAGTAAAGTAAAGTAVEATPEAPNEQPGESEVKS